MTCPMCGSDTKVTYTYDKDDHVIRDRCCKKCKYKFQTIEIDEDIRRRSNKIRSSEDDIKIKKLVAGLKEITTKLSDLGDKYD